MQFKKALTHNIILKSINVLVLFFSNVLFVRIMGANITGDFFYLVTILSFITLIVSSSMEAGITFYASKNTSNSHLFAVLIIFFSIFQIILSFVIISITVNNQTSLSLVYLIVFVVSNILISNFTALYISRLWFVSVNAVILIINFIALLFFWQLLMQYQVEAISKAQKIYIISFFVQAIGLIILFFIKTGIHNWQIPSINIFKKVFKYSFVALIGNISFFLVTRVDYVFVKILCSSQDLGNYVQVSKMGQMFVLLPAMAASVIFPFTVINKENILLKVQWLCRLMTMIFIVSAIFIILFGKWLFPWFFGKDFNLMYPAMLLYLPGIFGLCISSLLASFISGKGFISVNVTASIIALVIVIIGDVIFIPKYGINAAAALSSIAYFACMLFLLKHYIKEHHSKLTAFFSISFTEFKYLFSYITNKNKK